MPVAEPTVDEGGRDRRDDAILEVEDLHVEFRTTRGVVRAVNGLSYTLRAGHTLAILGESGSGKSVSSLAVMGLLECPPASIRGSVRYDGRDLTEVSSREWRTLRGRRIAMVFQDALSSLNPVICVGEQIAEMYRMHTDASRADARRRAIDVLDRVHIPSAADRFHDYPHQFSGGMRQRVMIAVAIALDPEILIADEPTTALDVTVQAQIMELLKTLQDDTGMSLVLITHDLGVVAETADDVVVMYAGRAAESGPITDVFTQPAHPYTLGLMRSVPSVHTKSDQLQAIGGAPPNLAAIPEGCAFHPRCQFRREVCWTEAPPLEVVSDQHQSACYFHEQVPRGS